jgi:hypothetical protein
LSRFVLSCFVLFGSWFVSSCIVFVLSCPMRPCLTCLPLSFDLYVCVAINFKAREEHC